MPIRWITKPPVAPLDPGPVRLLHGDCRDAMRTMEADSVDAIVTDPPYGLEFMGKDWDKLDVRQPWHEGYPKSEAGPYLRAKVRHASAASYGGAVGKGMQDWHYAWAVEALRVAKPGAHLLAFGGTRTHHRLMCALEDAGWEIRDTVMWVYGSGFPKSLDVSKAIDKAAGAEREVIGASNRHAGRSSPEGSVPDLSRYAGSGDVVTAPSTDDARQWSGWGTALKPAWEPIIVARKPLVGTVAANVQQHGTGALNIDGCRIETGDEVTNHARGAGSAISKGIYGDSAEQETHQTAGQALGRWPANVIHDGSDEVVLLFPNTDPSASGARGLKQRHDVSSPDTARPKLGTNTIRGHDDSGGSAARFFYCPKASGKDRNEGLHNLPPTEERKTPMAGRGQGGLKCLACGKWKNSGSPCVCAEPRFEQQAFAGTEQRNGHPTVKPTALMRYLCKLVTPPGGLILDPFMGSGSTGKAAVREGFRFAGIEQDQGYVNIAADRVAAELLKGKT